MVETWYVIAIKAKKNINLETSKSACSRNNFYQEFTSALQSSASDFAFFVNSNCTKKCLPTPLKLLRSKTGNIPKCETYEEELCAFDASNFFLQYVFDTEKACTTLEYSGPTSLRDLEWLEKNLDGFYWVPNNTFILSIIFARPGVVTVEEEFLVYDLVTMVGSVGGTLGMFIGFSFTNMITIFIDGIKLILEIIFHKKSKTGEIDDVVQPVEDDNDRQDIPSILSLLKRIEALEKISKSHETF